MDIIKALLIEIKKIDEAEKIETKKNVMPAIVKVTNKEVRIK
jgi:hypothetical protein